MTAKKKALLVTTVSGFVPQFEMNNVRILQEMGYEVHYASNFQNPSYGDDNRRLDGTGIVCHQIDFIRNPFHLSNREVYRQLCALMEGERFDLVHCHTPMGGVMARLAAHKTGTGPVIYTAHGFHFFRGASPLNWLCYYPVERFLSRYTDQQICMNREDYARARAAFHAKWVDYIPGAGIDLDEVRKTVRDGDRAKRKELGISESTILILSVGELIRRKNHETALRAVAGLGSSDIRYVICGHGEEEDRLKETAGKLGIADRVLFLGYREDILEICRSADLFLFPSYQEGLPRALLEAMASGLPVVCSGIRGNRDLMGEGEDRGGGLRYCPGGIMVDKPDDAKGFSRALRLMIEDRERWKDMGERNRERSEDFSLERVDRIMRKIYRRMDEMKKAPFLADLGD